MKEKKYIDLKEDPKIQQWIQTFSECQNNFNRDQLKLISKYCFTYVRANQRLNRDFAEIAQRSNTEFMINIKKLLQFCLEKNCKHDIKDLMFLESEYSLLVSLLDQLYLRTSIYIFCYIF